jgi:hypothetical protein
MNEQTRLLPPEGDEPGPLTFVALVRQMRAAQRRYYGNRGAEQAIRATLLRDALRLEGAVDKALQGMSDD